MAREYRFTEEQQIEIERVLKENPEWANPPGRLESLRLWVFDTGRVGQSLHYLWLIIRGGPASRREYLRSLWVTLRHGPIY